MGKRDGAYRPVKETGEVTEIIDERNDRAWPVARRQAKELQRREEPERATWQLLLRLWS